MAGANRMNWPRRGSLMVWPRVRARRIYPRIKNWPESDQTKLLGFIGYKVGMSHAMYQDNNPNSPTKNQSIFMPITIIECPSIKPLSLRFYKKTSSGLFLSSEIFSQNFDKNLIKIKSPKPKQYPQDFDDIRLVIYSQPRLTKIGKKKPDILEIKIGGKNNEEKLKLAKELLNKEIKITDVFKENQLIDIHAVTKGKGFQGTVKRFGVKIRQHKSEKVKRGVGTLGPWTPKKVRFSVAQPGKMGYHSRTEFNKQILRISSKPEDINPKGGFVNYGFVKNEYVLLKGSIPGNTKRPIVLTDPIRPSKTMPGEIISISLESKQ